MTPTVVCVLRTPGEYGTLHVRGLHACVRYWWPKDLPLRFVTLTDTPIRVVGVEERPLHRRLPGWWSKMELLAPEHDDLGDMLYLDLDTIVLGKLAPLLQDPKRTLLRDFFHPSRAQSGLMMLTKQCRGEADLRWRAEPHAIMTRHHGDGDFFDALWRQHTSYWQDKVPGLVVSYKGTVRQQPGQEVPAGTRVVCFHGRPRPWQTTMWQRYVEPHMQ